MSRSFTSSLIAGLLVAIGTVSAQQSPPSAPTPGPEHTRLKKLEGAWDAVMTEPDGKKTKGEMTYKMECGGLWLTSDFKGEHMGKPFHGKGLDSYDPAKKKYVGVWVDSWITNPLIMEGTYDEKTKTGTSIGECNGPDGKPMKMRMVTKTIDDDHETFEMYMTGPDGKETKGATIDYTRRKR
jgi:Protein of unknown function (DUF1579)